jgi:hypothetical protein
MRTGLAGLLLAALVASLSGCGVSSALGSAVMAPLTALPGTDVILDTNLQSAMQGGVTQAGLSGISDATGNGGGSTTARAPTTPQEVSVADETGVSMYTSFNPVDDHCLGLFVIRPGLVSPVLGESTTGKYYFWFGPTKVVDCTASNFTAEPTAPSGWAPGDPSSTGRPNE